MTRFCIYWPIDDAAYVRGRVWSVVISRWSLLSSRGMDHSSNAESDQLRGVVRQAGGWVCGLCCWTRRATPPSCCGWRYTLAGPPAPPSLPLLRGYVSLNLTRFLDMFCRIPTVRDVIKSQLEIILKRSMFWGRMDETQLYPAIVITATRRNFFSSHWHLPSTFVFVCQVTPLDQVRLVKFNQRGDRGWLSYFSDVSNVLLCNTSYQVLLRLALIYNECMGINIVDVALFKT